MIADHLRALLVPVAALGALAAAPASLASQSTLAAASSMVTSSSAVAAPAAVMHAAAPPAGPPAAPGASGELEPALLAEAEGRWDDALALHASARERRPADLDALLGMARAQQALARPWEAARLLEESLAAHPVSLRLRRAAGDAVLAVGSPAMALDHYERALELDPDDASSRSAAAWACALLGRHARVVELLEDTPAEQLAAPLQRALGRAALLGGRPELAAPALEALVAATPADAGAWLDLARARLLLGLDSGFDSGGVSGSGAGGDAASARDGAAGSALDAAQRALALEPAGAEGWVLAGHANLREGRRAEALAAYEEALRLGADAAALAPLLSRLRAAGGA